MCPIQYSILTHFFYPLQEVADVAADTAAVADGKDVKK
jgi:hypothetical protein